jgi:hypothetical protein
LAQVDPPFSDRAFCYNLGFVGRSGGFLSEKRRSSTDSTVACERGWSAPAPSIARSCRLHARTGAVGNFDPAVPQFVRANSIRPTFSGHWRANLGGTDLDWDCGKFKQPETRAVVLDLALREVLGFGSSSGFEC